MALVLGGCGVRQVQSGPTLDPGARWALLPIESHADSPQAGERAGAILGTLLRARGVVELRVAPPPSLEIRLTGETERRRAAALDWARTSGVEYAVVGSVEEWRYRGGFDGDPKVGLTIEVIQVATGRVVWSATGARTGWGRDGAAATAQHLLTELLGGLRLAHGQSALAGR